MRSVRADLDRAIDELRAQGWSIERIETTQSKDAVRLAREAAVEKVDALIAVGGDGTLNEAANGVIGSNTALGVLPVGTANVWAKEMGLPLGDLVSAARRLAHADVRLIDVGEVRAEWMTPRVFVLWCGIGLDAAITHSVEPQREMKRRLGALMFWLVGIREAWSFRGRRAILTLGEKRIRQRVILALAANTQLYGGITRIAPNAKVDDGELDLVLFKGTGAWMTALHVVQVLVGLHTRNPQVDFYSVARVKAEAKNLPVQVDGEPIGFTPVEIRVRPRALRVLVPKTANQNLFVEP